MIPSASTCLPSDDSEASLQAPPSSEPPALTDARVGDPAMAIDAPVLALIARLHAGTTLADRVRRMRGRRAGQAARRAAKTKGDDNDTKDERTETELAGDSPGDG